MKLLNRTEAAEAMYSTSGTLDKLRRAGGGPAFVLLGGRVFYNRNDVEDYLASRRVVPTSTKPAEGTKK